MKTLALAALLVGTSLASGCIITSDDDDDTGDGSFAFTWTLESGGNPETCASVGSGGVQSIVTRAGTAQGVADIFDCEPGEAVTPLFPFDDYVVVVNIVDQADPPGNLGSSMPRNVLLDADIVDLGNFVFDFPPATADVLFMVDYGAAGGANCLGTGGDEGVTDQETNLVLMGSTSCIAVSLEVQGVIDTDDICSEIPLCVETGIQQALLELEPDTYDMSLNGLVTPGGGGAAATCFRSVDRFSVTDGDENLGNLTVPFDDSLNPGGC